MTSEEMQLDVDPPEDLVAKFLPYIKIGTVAQMAMARPKNEDLKNIVQNYLRLYENYKELDAIIGTMDTHQHIEGENF